MLLLAARSARSTPRAAHHAVRAPRCRGVAGREPRCTPQALDPQPWATWIGRMRPARSAGLFRVNTWSHGVAVRWAEADSAIRGLDGPAVAIGIPDGARHGSTLLGPGCGLSGHPVGPHAATPSRPAAVGSFRATASLTEVHEDPSPFRRRSRFPRARAGGPWRARERRLRGHGASGLLPGARAGPRPSRSGSAHAPSRSGRPRQPSVVRFRAARVPLVWPRPNEISAVGPRSRR